MDYGLTGLIVNGAAIPPPGVSLWNSAVSGNWSDPTRWTGGVPDAVGAGAVFSPSTGAALTITLDSPRTVGSLHFGNSGSSTAGCVLTGSRSNTLSLNNSGSGAPITVADGSHIFDAPLVLVDNLVVSGSGKLTFGSSSSIAETAGRHSLTMSGTGGTLVLSGSNSFTGGTAVTSGTLILASSAAVANATGLTVGTGTAAFGAAAVAPAADRPVGVPEPSTLVLLAAGAIGLLGYKWPRRE
jgi:autotransporter-associated beta strand protein